MGAGPAGSAAAITIRDRCPELSVGLIEASLFDEPRVGEILSPAAVPVLERLGLTEVFQRECSRLVYAAAVSWGREALIETPHLFSLHVPGWHLNRARFDALLTDEAERRGVEVRRASRVVRAENSGGAWSLLLASGETARSRFAIDATGRRGTIARAAGAHIIPVDHLVGFVCTLDSSQEDPRTCIEAVDYGWWYTAALSGGTRIAACMTDSDIGRHLNLSDRENWLDRLRATIHVAGAVRRKGVATHRPMVRSAASQYLSSVCGSGWIAAGDAALAVDPLSGQGILAALRSGIFAAYAVGDWVRYGDPSGLSRYQNFMERTREGYFRARRRYYSDEARWPQSAFWQRRSSGRAQPICPA